MTKEEAERIVKNVSCHCDGYGVVPGPNGVAVKCTDCDGEFVSNAQLHDARRVLKGLSNTPAQSRFA